MIKAKQVSLLSEKPDATLLRSLRIWLGTSAFVGPKRRPRRPVHVFDCVVAGLASGCEFHAENPRRLELGNFAGDAQRLASKRPVFLREPFPGRRESPRA